MAAVTVSTVPRIAARTGAGSPTTPRSCRPSRGSPCCRTKSDAHMGRLHARQMFADRSQQGHGAAAKTRRWPPDRTPPMVAPKNTSKSVAYWPIVPATLSITSDISIAATSSRPFPVQSSGRSSPYDDAAAAFDHVWMPVRVRRGRPRHDAAQTSLPAGLPTPFPTQRDALLRIVRNVVPARPCCVKNSASNRL